MAPEASIGRQRAARVRRALPDRCPTPHDRQATASGPRQARQAQAGQTRSLQSIVRSSWCRSLFAAGHAMALGGRPDMRTHPGASVTSTIAYRGAIVTVGAPASTTASTRHPRTAYVASLPCKRAAGARKESLPEWMRSLPETNRPRSDCVTLAAAVSHLRLRSPSSRLIVRTNGRLGELGAGRRALPQCGDDDTSCQRRERSRDQHIAGRKPQSAPISVRNP